MSKIRRFRKLAETALDAYTLGDARFKFLTIAGNILFRVYDSSLPPSSAKNNPFEPGQYLLRIHDSIEQKTDAIRLEMEWLRAIRTDAWLPVPEPLHTRDGRLLAQVYDPEMGEKRDCTVLRWLKGRRVIKRVCPHHFQSQGRIMAQLHNHAETWSPADGHGKRRFDYDGLFKDNAGAGIPNSEAWALLPDRYRGAYEKVARRFGKVANDWGKGPEVYGLIHGDCGIDANVLFWNGQARIIDFDGSGFGYYLYDLALALEHCWEEPAYAEYLEALLKGYAEFRPLPVDHLQYMDMFRAAFYVYMGLWTVAIDKMYPDSPNKIARHKKWLEYGFRFIDRFLSSR